jgi:hypothetical protein
MLFATSMNALRSRSQSIFDLKLSQSQTSSSDSSSFGPEFTWLYDQHQAATAADSATPSTPLEEPAQVSQQPTDCLFFQQFMSMHQTANKRATGANSHATELAQINTFLGQRRASEEST